MGGVNQIIDGLSLSWKELFNKSLCDKLSAPRECSLNLDGIDDVRTSISIDRPRLCLKAELCHAQAAAAGSGLMIALCSGRPMPGGAMRHRCGEYPRRSVVPGDDIAATTRVDC